MLQIHACVCEEDKTAHRFAVCITKMNNHLVDPSTYQHLAGLSILSGLLHEDHSFESSKKTLRQYRLFEFEKKQNKQRIAHRKVKLPSNK
ncbi:hypothetical protein GQ600_8874 [Phytophthora cactorum]|nr:hypothetical protein GQ600_8874 [Phytophthora cactorum]